MSLPCRQEHHIRQFKYHKSLNLTPSWSGFFAQFPKRY